MVGALALAACSKDEVQAQADRSRKAIERKQEAEKITGPSIGKGEDQVTPTPSELLPLMASPRDFEKNHDGHTLILPTPECDLQPRIDELSVYARSIRPTFDGVSPWPGLLGVWLYQKAGISAVITPQYSSLTNVDGTSVRLLTVKFRLVDLCKAKHEQVIAEGERTVRAPKNPLSKIKIKIEKHSLNQIDDLEVEIYRLGMASPKDPKKQEPLNDVMGMELKYRLKGANKNDSLSEGILLKNVLLLK